MSEVNPELSSLSVGTLLDSRSICLIMVEEVRIVLAPGSASGGQHNYASPRGSLVVNLE